MRGQHCSAVYLDAVSIAIRRLPDSAYSVGEQVSSCSLTWSVVRHNAATSPIQISVTNAMSPPSKSRYPVFKLRYTREV